jgi:DNA-binding response OmpR family regulator/signal transduction histidine kinase
MESLANTAGQVLERLTLMHIYLEKSGRLEAILRSVSEGIFFVDEHNCVVYCNPQFTELTGINRSEVLDQDSQAVLERLAQRSADVSQTLNLFQKAIISLPDAREYPIVEITLDNPRRQVHVELVVIENIGDSNVAWAGVIRDNQRFKNLFTNQMSLLGAMPQLTRVHYAEVRGLIATLVEQHNNMTSKDRHYLLRKVEHSLEKSSQLWDNFSELYSLEVTGLVLDREQIDPQELVQTVFDYRYFSRYRRRCDITAANRLSLVNVDAFHMRRALANVLHYALEETVPDSKVTINLERVGRNLNTTFQFTHAGGDKTNLDQIFEGNHKQSPTSDQSLETDGSIGLYLSNEIVRKHGGSIQTTTVSGNTTSIIVTLPAVPAEDEAETESPEDEVKEAVEPGALARVPARTPQKIMVFRGQSTVMEEMINLLTEQNYDLLLYQSTQDAMRDLGTTRLDLILLDARLPDDDSLQVCERIRKRTEVPLVVLADEPSNSEKILALNIGADDYISQPVDEEEMLARINVIFKRQQLPDRAREPLELGDLYIDFARREVFYHNRPIELTRIEYDLLRVLALNADQVLTHEQLLTQVWGPEYRNETHYLWVNVSRLRKKVEPTPDSPRFIHNQPGIGYVFRQP